MSKANKSGLSRFVSERSHQLFKIFGPYGMGLELKEDSNGTHVIYCIGTGILPFLDLLDFLLKKAVYIVMK